MAKEMVNVEKKEEIKMFNQHQVMNVEGATRVFLGLKQGDSLVVKPHLLNPLLRIIETMELACLVETTYYTNSDERAYRVFKQVTSRTPNNEWYPQIMQVKLLDNPNYCGSGNLE